MPVYGGAEAISGVYAGDIPADALYLGDTLLWQRINGITIADDLSSTAQWITAATSGSGISFSGGEAGWSGNTDGQAVLLNRTSANTDDQYVSAVISGSMASRGTGIIFHADDALSGYYAAVFYSGNIKLVRTSGRFTQNTVTEIAAVTPSVSSGQLVEAWNIGDRFKVRHNGNVVIDTVIAGSVRGAGRRRQGFGMYRSSFQSGQKITQWEGGDVSGWGITD